MRTKPLEFCIVEFVGETFHLSRNIYIPSGKRLQFAIENGPVEIVDFPSYKMVIFHSFLYVYHRVYIYMYMYMYIYIYIHI